MAKKMKYTISFESLDLIKLVRDRPCLWDKNHEDYKEKNYKDEAWNDIYNTLVPEFDHLDDGDKMIAAKTIGDKWKNIRDSFAHSLRRSQGGKRSKKYIHFEELKFLLNVIKAGNADNLNLNKIFIKRERKPSITMDKPETEYSVTGSQQSLKQNEFKLTEGTSLDITQPMTHPMMDMDEDMAFFVSLLPSLRKLNDDDKLEFRMGVLTIVKNIRDKNSLMD